MTYARVLDEHWCGDRRWNRVGNGTRKASRVEDEDDYDICAEASNGQEAIDLALKHRPELIILDLAMPVLGGLDASKELKRIMPTVPIILFTQYADLGDALSGNGLLVDRIVQKGDVRGLMEHVRSLLPV